MRQDEGNAVAGARRHMPFVLMSEVYLLPYPASTGAGAGTGAGPSGAEAGTSGVAGTLMGGDTGGSVGGTVGGATGAGAGGVEGGGVDGGGASVGGGGLLTGGGGDAGHFSGNFSAKEGRLAHRYFSLSARFKPVMADNCEALSPGMKPSMLEMSWPCAGW
jgi:hypothetical protein